METEILIKLAQVAGIGGISLGVFMLIFRDIIQKNIFPKFKNEKLAFSLLRMMVILVWSVAIIGIAAWTYTTASNGQVADTIEITNNEFSGEMRYVNINVVQNGHEDTQQNSLSPEQMKEIERATNLVKGGFYGNAIPILEKVARQAEIPALYNNLGVLYAVTGDANTSRKFYMKAVEKNPDDKNLKLNLGLLAEKEGQIDQAIKFYETSSEPSLATKARKRIQQKRQAGTIEVEPNNQILEPNEIGLKKWVQGKIASSLDRDFFFFTTPQIHRDFIKIEIKNQSTTLKTSIVLYDANKHQLWNHNGYYSTPGQDLEHTFVSAPGAGYHLAISGYDSFGDYQFIISALKAYDVYEPNNDIQHAKALVMEKEIDASIMDQGDWDYYRIKNSSAATTINISLDNPSATLKASIMLYDANKHQLWSQNGYYSTPGQNLTHAFTATPDSQYYIAIGGYESGGHYKLTVSGQK